MSLAAYLDQSAAVLLQTRSAQTEAAMEQAVQTLATALRADKTVLVCGNGGSAADAAHITGELVGRFLRERRALKAICLSSNMAVLTAWANDYAYETVFSRQVEAYGEAGGVLIGLSTSGNSPNVLAAFTAARSKGMQTIALTGAGGGRLAPLSDILLAVPATHTPLIQQGHICLYHYLCERVEAELAG